MSNPSRLSRRTFCALAPAVAGLPLTRANSGAQTSPTTTDAAKIVAPPLPRREFRGVWIATVDNIDWPSRRDLTSDQQKAELLTLLDRAVQLNLNAVLLQVRPSCDALYASPIEPWSAYLTGQLGKAPAPFYDPLEFAVSEAHKRGLELHAWCNPFRVRQSGAANAAAASATNHVSQAHPEWVRSYGKMLWLDPGERAARDYSLSVFRDIVSRYDIDGIHIDDYFYPYKITDSNDKEVDFPDDATFSRYQSSGGALSRSDWRRANIDDFVSRMYTDTKAIKPWVKVGISPFGIWRPGNPEQIKGFDSFDELYGDSRRWLREGWADYFTPQLYWKIEQTPQSFPVLLGWWLGENVKGRHIWPGLYTSRAAGAHPKWPMAEVEFQIKTTRGLVGANSGQVHFSGQFLLDGSIADAGTLPRHLSETVYDESVPVPEMAWLATGSGPIDAAAPPEAMTIAVSPASGSNPVGQGWSVKWTASASSSPWQWLVQWRAGSSKVWHQIVVPGAARQAILPSLPLEQTSNQAPAAPDAVAVIAINRVGTASAATTALLPANPAPSAPK